MHTARLVDSFRYVVLGFVATMLAAALAGQAFAQSQTVN